MIIRQTNYASAYNYDQILPVVATALGIVGSIFIGRLFTKKGRARGAANPLGENRIWGSSS